MIFGFRYFHGDRNYGPLSHIWRRPENCRNMIAMAKANNNPTQAEQLEKEIYIKNVFDAIADHYDRMNMIMTGGLLRYWQRVFQRNTGLKPGDHALDVASGTAELALIMARQVGEQGHVWGIDLSPQMLRVGQLKVDRAGLSQRITLLQGNALRLPFEDNSFHCVATGFAMRNVADITTAIKEMVRVTKPGGRVLCLELSHPPNPIFRIPFGFYFRRIVPLLGRWSESRFRRQAGASGLTPYRWLPESLRNFPKQESLAQEFRSAGLVDVTYTNLSGGIVCLHQGVKPR